MSSGLLFSPSSREGAEILIWSSLSVRSCRLLPHTAPNGGGRPWGLACSCVFFFCEVECPVGIGGWCRICCMCCLERGVAFNTFNSYNTVFPWYWSGGVRIGVLYLLHVLYAAGAAFNTLNSCNTVSRGEETALGVEYPAGFSCPVQVDAGLFGAHVYEFANLVGLDTFGMLVDFMDYVGHSVAEVLSLPGFSSGVGRF